MAKVLAPLLSLQASGPLGGINFLRAGSSTHVGLRPGNSWPLTAKSSQVRADFQRTVAAWHALDPEIRAAWAAPSLGSDFAWQNYLSASMRWLSVGMQPQAVPIPLSGPFSVPEANWVAEPSQPSYVGLAWSPQPGLSCFVRLSAANSTLHRASVSPRKFVQVGYAPDHYGAWASIAPPRGAVVFWKAEWISADNGQILWADSQRFVYPDPYVDL